MSRAVWFGLIIGVVIVVGGLAFLRHYHEQEAADAAGEAAARTAVLGPSVADEATPEPENTEAPVKNPVPEPDASATPLPELDDSDESALVALRELFGAEPVESFLVPKEVIRRIVLNIDSLDREPLPLWLRPVRRMPGSFTVKGSGEVLSIDPVNTRRYDRLVAALDAVDAQRLAAAYKRYYPLFQDAYDKLGNPRARYFNDRLIAIIDHLIDTPQVPEPIALARPKVVYLFADTELEELSSGQKMMLRIGRDHAAAVKRKLSEIRSHIAAAPPAG